MNLTDWLTAIGTIGAFAVSLYLLARDQHYRLEVQREKQRDQFKHLSAWIDEPFIWIRGESRKTSVKVNILNSGSEPIYRCLIEIDVHFSKEKGSTRYPLMRDVVPPMTTPREEIVEMEGILRRLAGSSDISGSCSVRYIEAIDTAARMWRRTRYGRIEFRLSDAIDDRGWVAAIPEDVTPPSRREIFMASHFPFKLFVRRR